MLKALQEIADTPEKLASIPVLKLSDMERKNRIFPVKNQKRAGQGSCIMIFLPMA
jgi:hypothetical protein